MVKMITTTQVDVAPSAPPRNVALPPAPILTVQVRSLPAETVVVAGKTKRIYSCELSVGGQAVQTVTGRFSDLRARFADFMASDGSQFSFPSRHAFQNFSTKEANVSQRAEELCDFLRKVLNQQDEGRLLRSSKLLHALVASPELVTALASIAAERKGQADAKRAAEAARRQLIDQEQRANCQHAQEFNRLIAYSNLPMGVFTTIAFPRQQVFELRNKWWYGDATIRGPGGHPWFTMLRTNPSIFGELAKNAQFVISTMSGEPLLLLQETWHWASYEYNLFRIDPRCPGQPIHACRIMREWGNNFLTITDQYDIDLTPATQHQGRLVCQGRWPSQFTLFNAGAVQSTVVKEIFTWTDTYQVTIAPNADCLLFVGIACAIDRIHHEVEDRRRRR